MVNPARFEVWLIALDPTLSSEIKKTRPCVVVAPDEMQGLRTTIVAPLTKTVRSYPTRVPVRFQRQKGEVALDQIRAVDKNRLLRRLGKIPRSAGDRILGVLGEMFQP
jgi:mRNA interferase MazF